jgi:hypothetical protein
VASQCPPASCAVFVRKAAVWAMDTTGLGGDPIRLDVDKELSAFQEAVGDLAARAQALGLEDCRLLAGDK